MTFNEGEIGQQRPVASCMNCFKGLSTKNVMFFFYSRQRYMLGDGAMIKMAQSKVFLSGLGGLGVEIGKLNAKAQAHYTSYEWPFLFLGYDKAALILEMSLKTRSDEYLCIQMY